jgi:hypothetical protein
MHSLKVIDTAGLQELVPIKFRELLGEGIGESVRAGELLCPQSGGKGWHGLDGGGDELEVLLGHGSILVKFLSV